jgi:hypothetical protein
MTEERNPPQPNDEVEDLDVPEDESEHVKGGVRKAGKGQEEFLVVKLDDTIISG